MRLKRFQEPMPKIGFQTMDPGDRYFGDHPERERYVNMIRMQRIPVKGERLMFLDWVYEVHNIVTDLTDGSLLIVVKQVGPL